MNQPRRYVGIDNDINGGMTDTAKIIRDGWVFDLIPEEETCEGWDALQLEDLWRRVNDEWEKYGFLVGNLPETMRDKFMRVQDAAVKRAKAAGWDADDDLADEQ